MARNKVNTIYSDEKQKRNYRPLLKAIAVILAITVIIMTAVLLTRLFGIEHLVSKQGGGVVTNPRTGVTYNLMLPCPYWVNLDISDPYAECDGVEFYKIVYNDTDGNEQHCDPLKMIASIDEDEFVNLYLAQGFSLPTLEEMNPDTGFVFYIQVKEVPAGVLTIEQTKTVTDLILNGEKAVYPPNVDTSTRRNIYLASVNHIYIRYTVEFFATEDGEMYLQDPASGKCVKATAELSEIFGSSSEL